MTKVAFFIYDEWAFGSIHKALVKEFYKRGIYADLIAWQKTYSENERRALANTYDIWVSTPGPSLKVLTDIWNIDKSRIVMISHAGWDIEQAVEHNNDLSSIKGYGAICNYLIDYGKVRGITAPVKLLQNGIMFENFYRPASTSLDNIGYAGKIKWENHFDGVTDIKRSYLVSSIARMTKTPLILPGMMSHLCMPGFYPTVDTVVVSSHEHEACALPLMEAAAAGRLPIAANVGINADMENPTGVILPIDETGFVKEGVEIINELKKNPELHHRKCLEAQDFAREYYDWSKVIDPWIDLIVGP